MEEDHLNRVRQALALIGPVTSMHSRYQTDAREPLREAEDALQKAQEKIEEAFSAKRFG